MKNNIDLKSLIIGFLMAMCIVLSIGMASIPDTIEVKGKLMVEMDNSVSLEVSNPRMIGLDGLPSRGTFNVDIDKY